MFGIAGTVELGTICPGTGTWNRLQDGILAQTEDADRVTEAVGCAATYRCDACSGGPRAARTFPTISPS